MWSLFCSQRLYHDKLKYNILSEIILLTSVLHYFLRYVWLLTLCYLLLFYFWYCAEILFVQEIFFIQMIIVYGILIYKLCNLYSQLYSIAFTESMSDIGK